MSGAETDEDRPAVSVVVAAWSGEGPVSRCLDSLEPQRGGAEVIVALNSDAEVVRRLEERYPAVRFVQGSPGASVFELRTLGVTHARGRLIALTEDHTAVGPRWVDALCAGHRQGHGIVGGPVDNGLVRRAYDWALYFCEYGLYMPPMPEGQVSLLSGINVAYDRRLLMSCLPVWQRTLQENEVHDALRASGQSLHLVPDAWVASHLPFTLGQAMKHLFAGGRHFARYRVSRSSWWGRLFWVAASPAVPVVLTLRIAGRVASRQPARLWHLLRGLGYFVLLLGAWSAGEASGYLGGRRPAASRVGES